MSGLRVGLGARRLSAPLALALGLALAFVAPAVRAQEAQQAQQPIIAILDVQDVLQEATAGQALQAEIDKREQALKAELEKRENALLAADQQLAQQRGSLSQEEFAAKRNQLAQQLAEVRNYAQTQRQAIGAVLRKGETQMLQALLQIVTEIAQARKITMVLDKRQVVLAPSEYDISQEALEKLNAKMPSINLAN